LVFSIDRLILEQVKMPCFLRYTSYIDYHSTHWFCRRN